MANNYEYSIQVGVEVSQQELNSEINRVRDYLSKSKSATFEVKALFNNEDLEKKIVSTRNLLDKLTGEPIGKIETFQIENQFIEVQKTVSGTIKSITQLEQSMRRLDSGGIKGVDDIGKKLEALFEKVRQLNSTEIRSLINQNDLNDLNDATTKVANLQNNYEMLMGAIAPQVKLSNNISKEMDAISNELKLLRQRKELLEESQESDKIQQQEFKSRIDALQTQLQIIGAINGEIIKEGSNLDEVRERIVSQKQRFNEIVDELKRIESFSGSIKPINLGNEELDKVNRQIATLDQRVQELSSRHREINKEIGENKSLAIKVYTEEQELINGIEIALQKTNNAVKDYKSEVKLLSTEFKQQITEAGKLQGELNKAYGSGNFVLISKLQSQIESLNQNIKETGAQLTNLTGSSRTVENLTSKYGQSYAKRKDEESYAREAQSIKLLEQQMKELFNTEKKLMELEQNTSVHTRQIKAYEQKRQAIEEEISALTSNGNVIQYVCKNLEKQYNEQLKIIQAKNQDTKATQEAKDALENYKSQLNTLVDLRIKEIQYIERSQKGSSSLKQEYLDLAKACRDNINEIEQSVISYKNQAQETERAKEALRLYEEYTKKVDTGVKENTAALHAQKEGLYDVNIGFESLGDTVAECIQMFMTFDKVLEIIQKVYGQVMDLNEAMTNVQLVTGESASEIAQTARNYSNLAQELGATTKEVAAGASEWLRQGKSAEETGELIRASMILSKVGAMEASEATEKLTSALNGYGLSSDKAMSVVDKLTRLDLVAATSTEELATAMSRTANVANDMGVSMDTLLGYITTVSEATRRAPESIGNSFRTLFSRLSNVKVGKYVDDLSQGINDVEKVLNKQNIKLRESETEWRRAEDVIADVANRWNEFSDIDKNAIVTALAGVEQAETLRALFANWNKNLQYQQESINSLGSASEKFGIYTESLESKVKTLQAALDKIIYSEEVVEVIGNIIDSITKLINWFDEFSNTTAGQFVIKMALIAASLQAGASLIESYNSANSVLGKTMRKLAEGFGNFFNVVGNANTIFGTFTSAAQKASQAVSAAGTATAATSGTVTALTSTLGSQIAVWGGLAIAIGAVIAIIYEVATAQKRLSDNLIESNQQYEDQKNKVQSLKDESKLLNAQIDSLLKKGTLTVVEEAELSKLREENRQLEYQIQLEERLLKIKQDKARLAAERFVEEGKNIYNPDEVSKDYSGVQSSYNDFGVRGDRGFQLLLPNKNDVNSIIAFTSFYTSELDKLDEKLSDIQQNSEKYTSGEIKMWGDRRQQVYNHVLALQEMGVQAADVVNQQITALESVGDQSQQTMDKIAMLRETSTQLILSSMSESEAAIYKAQELINSTDFVPLKEKIQEAFNNNELTANFVENLDGMQEHLDNLGISAEDFASIFVKDMESTQQATENASGSLDEFGNELEELSLTAEETSAKAVQSTIDMITNLKEEFATIETIKEEISQLGYITDESLSKIIEYFPQLSEATESYLLNLASTEDVLVALTEAYEVDKNNYIEAQIAKLESNTEFFNQLMTNNQSLIDYINETYNIDLSNCRTYLEAKQELNRLAIENMGKAFEWLDNLMNQYYSKDSRTYQGYLNAKQQGEAALLSWMSINWNQVLANIEASAINSGNRIKSFFSSLNAVGTKIIGGLIDAKPVQNVVGAYNSLHGAALNLQNISFDKLTASTDKLTSSLGSAGKGSDKLSDSLKKQQQAQKDAAKAAKEQADAYDDLIDLIVKMLKQRAKEKKEALKEELDDAKEAYDEEKDALKDLYDEKKKLAEKAYKSAKELTEKERDEALKAIEDQLEAYEKIIDQKLSALKKEQDEHKYQNEVSERLEEIAELEDSINEIANDDSITGRKKRLELEAQLAEKQKELTEFQYEREKELAEDALEEELDRYKEVMEANKEMTESNYQNKLDQLEKEYEAEKEHLENWYNTTLETLEKNFEALKSALEAQIKEVEDYLSKEGSLRREAMAMLESDYEGTINQLLEWNRVWGSGTDKTIWDIINSWKNANDAIQDDVAGIGDSISGMASSAASDIGNMASSGAGAIAGMASAGVTSVNNMSSSISSILDKLRSNIQSTISMANEVMNSHAQRPLTTTQHLATQETYGNTWQFQQHANNLSNNKFGSSSNKTSSSSSKKKNPQTGVSTGSSLLSSVGSTVDRYLGGLKKMHDGGFVDDDNVKKNKGWSRSIFDMLEDDLNEDEIYAKLQKGEYVTTKAQQNIINSLVYNPRPVPTGDIVSSNTGVSVGEMMKVVVEGNLDETVVPDLERLANICVEKINKITKQRGIRTNAKASAI